MGVSLVSPGWVYSSELSYLQRGYLDSVDGLWMGLGFGVRLVEWLCELGWLVVGCFGRSESGWAIVFGDDYFVVEEAIQ
jgi:hypothetical protein